MSQSDEIKQKLDIVEIIRGYVNVKAVGVNFQAVCPFHNEKTPSFVISPDKQIWHCFGCGRGGDVFSFVMEKEGLDFMETLRLLAPKAGVTLQYEDRQTYSRRNRLLDILELAGKYYARMLQMPAGKNALKYLQDRGLSAETMEEWKLGYSPDAWDDLYNFLKTRPKEGNKYTDEEIFLTGLSIKKEKGSGYYDRFRDRIMFPIFDVNSNLIAFTARVNPAKEKTEKMGKYINSPKTEMYDKSKVLFALNKARTNIRKEDSAIVVEGQMDAISCHQHGFANVIASSGTALTTDQVTLIKRFSKNISLAFDMDDAGQMAADRGIKEALAQELNLKVVTLPSGKDPDECLRNNPSDFKKSVEDAQPILEYYFNKITTGLDLSELDNKKLVAQKMLEMIIKVNNNIEQDYWIKRTAEDLDIREDLLRETLEAKIRPSRPKKELKSDEVATTGELSREERLSELLLSLLVKFPDFISYSINNLDPEYIIGNEKIQFYKSLIIYYNRLTSLDYDNFRIYLEEQGDSSEKLLDRLVLLGEKDFYDYDNNRIKGEIITILVNLKKHGCQKRIKQLERNMAQAEKDGNEDQIKILMDELKNLTDQLKEININ